MTVGAAASVSIVCSEDGSIVSVSEDVLAESELVQSLELAGSTTPKIAVPFCQREVEAWRNFHQSATSKSLADCIAALKVLFAHPWPWPDSMTVRVVTSTWIGFRVDCNHTKILTVSVLF